MKTPKQPKPTRADLERKVQEALAGQAHTYHFASQSIGKASTAHMMSSGVMLTLTALGGREIISPVLIRDGLSEETIAAIKRDLKRSYDLATMYKVGEVPEVSTIKVEPK